MSWLGNETLGTIKILAISAQALIFNYLSHGRCPMRRKMTANLKVEIKRRGSYIADALTYSIEISERKPIAIKFLSCGQV